MLSTPPAMMRSASPARIALAAVTDRVKAGAAEPVDGRTRDRLWQAGEQRRHARDIAVVFAGLIGAA